MASNHLPVHIESATKADLMSIAGVGDTKAAKILAARDNNGGKLTLEGFCRLS